MLLKASQSPEEIRSATERSLTTLGYSFIRNGTERLCEYEISSPKYFRIVIESRQDPEVHNFIIPSIRSPTGCTIEIRFGLDASAVEFRNSSLCASNYLQKLSENLSHPPWQGLRQREVGRERRRWKDALESELFDK